MIIYSKYKILEYCDVNQKASFRDKLNLMPNSIIASVDARIFRAENGNLGDFKSVGSGVFEMRVHVYGIRVYFCFEGENIILLLAVGNKASQKKDIITAKKRRMDFLSQGQNL